MSYSVSTTKSLEELTELADQLTAIEKWKLVTHLVESLKPELRAKDVPQLSEDDRIQRAAWAANSVSTHEDWDQYKARQARSYPPLEGEHHKLSPDDLKALNEEQMKIAMALRRRGF